jgi:hypothetical protein
MAIDRDKAARAVATWREGGLVTSHSLRGWSTIRVRATRTILDNGVQHAVGDEWDMQVQLAAVRSQLGHIELVEAGTVNDVADGDGEE